jgi:NADPH:quinone reductase-like Zn-dependent oxidoreductase
LFSRSRAASSFARYDLFLDNVGNRTLSAMTGVPSPNGNRVMTGALKELSAVFIRVLKHSRGLLFCGRNSNSSFANINRDGLMSICELIKAGKVTPVIESMLPAG